MSAPDKPPPNPDKADADLAYSALSDALERLTTSLRERFTVGASVTVEAGATVRWGKRSNKWGLWYSKDDSDPEVELSATPVHVRVGTVLHLRELVAELRLEQDARIESVARAAVYLEELADEIEDDS